MLNLTTRYMGLELKNPLIVGSCGLTNSIENLKHIEENGAGAVVLKSIFEEQIRYESDLLMNQKDSELMKPMHKGFEEIMNKRSYDYSEALQYISNFAREHTMKEYLGFITTVKKTIKIPVIASINCVFAYDWQFFARRIQDAGADAIELNIFVLPSDLNRSSDENEKMYFEIVEKVRKFVSIPVALKISYYFSSLVKSVISLSNCGIDGMVLFNRPVSPDIDIEKFTVTASNIFSSASEYSQTLRWVAILSGRLGCSLAAATGIHNHEALIKQLLAGADVVQMTSALYKNGFTVIKNTLDGLMNWMEAHQFKTIDDFRGKMSQKYLENPAVFERVQFMKLYSQIE